MACFGARMRHFFWGGLTIDEHAVVEGEDVLCGLEGEVTRLVREFQKLLFRHCCLWVRLCDCVIV